MKANELKLALFLSWKFIAKSKKATLILIILIISAAFANIVFIMSFFEGVNERLDRNIRDFLTSDIKLESDEEGKFIDDVEQLKKKILSIKGVSGVSSFYHIPAFATLENRTRFFDTRTISDEDAAAGIDLRQTLVAGEFLEKMDRDEVLIGKDVSGKYGSYLEEYSLKADLGDKIIINFGSAEKEYEIKGVLDANIYDIDLEIFFREEEIEELLGFQDQASAVVVKTSKHQDMLRIKRDIFNIAGTDKIYFWWERRGLSENLSDSFAIIELVLGTISLFVAAFSIVIVLYLNLIQKKKHIGLMKAIGVSKDAVVLSYTMQSLFFCICGILISTLCMYAFVIPYFTNNPIPFPIGMIVPIIKWQFVIVPAVGFILVAILAGIIPVRRMLDQKTIALLWGEQA